MLKIGIINYINALPFWTPFIKGALKTTATFMPGVPSQLNRALLEGECDISLISSTEYLQNRDNYVLLPHFCIAAKRQIQSVRLYIRNEIAALDNKELGITSQSASSAALVKILCHHYWHIKPIFKTFSDSNLLKKCEAFLLIGDDCLLNPKIDGYYSLDLAQVWYHLTGLNFAFALFAARKNVYENAQDEIARIEQELLQALDWSNKYYEEIETMAILKCPLPKETIREYYSLIEYRMNPGYFKSLDIFASLISTI